MRGVENLERAFFEGIGDFDIPEIPSVYDVPGAEFIPFNFARTCRDPENFGVHFFIDDYQFLRLWNSPGVYLEMLKKFKCVFSPDFSIYTDMPKALQIYNHYRKHWLARFFAENGITVIPTISWSTPDSFSWCFDGEPKNSVAAISNVGCMRVPESRELFFLGLEEMKRRLEPSVILCYGTEVEGTVHLEPYYKKIEEARKNGRKRS